MNRRVRNSTAGMALALAFTSPLASQALTIPDDWTARLDAPQEFAVGQDVATGEWRYVTMPPGWHMTTTSAGVSVFPKHRTVHGRWALEVELFLLPNPSDSAFGFILGRAPDAQGEARDLRFLMRRDGAVAFRDNRSDDPKVATLWQADTTGALAHDGTSVTKYVLRAVHESGHLVFSVNGVERFAIAIGGEDPVVIPGFRLGPGLNVHIARYDVIEPLAPARVRSGG